MQKISIKYTATAIIKRLKEIKFSHNPLLPFFIKQSPKNSKPRGVKPQKYTGPANHKCNICTKFKRNIWRCSQLSTWHVYLEPPFFQHSPIIKKKNWSKATKSIQLLIISNVITAKFSSYGATRHGSWESVTNNFGTCVFLRTAVILNSLTPIDVT